MGASLPGWVLAGCGWWCEAVPMLQWYSEPAKLHSPGIPLPPCPPALLPAPCPPCCPCCPCCLALQWRTRRTASSPSCGTC